MDTLYVRTLKHADHTVFGVSSGQKTYYHAQFNRYQPYSSGQQVKRSVLESIYNYLGVAPSPTTFVSQVVKKGKGKAELGEGEVFGTCDPSYVDQLFGGWMKASKGGKDRTLKRRSPLSISAMRPLHPFLASVDKENATFDRRERPNNEVLVRDVNGDLLSEEEILPYLEGKDRSLSMKWIPDNKRTTGLFVHDMAIDLRRLFTVSTSNLEPEMSPATIEKLKENGWEESDNVFGPCLLAPKSIRDEWSKALVHGIVNWRITSNQSRTFSLMDTLAIGVSDNANKIAGSIRAQLKEEDSTKAEPVVDERVKGVDVFTSVQASAYFPTVSESTDAVDEAATNILDRINSFYQK